MHAADPAGKPAEADNAPKIRVALYDGAGNSEPGVAKVAELLGGEPGIEVVKVKPEDNQVRLSR